MSGVNQKAEHLKAQGNECHQNGQYEEAYRRFTEAIEADPTNAIYYANRAASGLAMTRYMGALDDALKATKLDSHYAKAWARLATASYKLSMYNRSIEAWESALRSLPSQENSTEKENDMRTQFTAELKKSEIALRSPIDKTKAVIYKVGDKRGPWNRAEEIAPQLIAHWQTNFSSSFAIMEAYQELKKGVNIMVMLKEFTLDGKAMLCGDTGALVHISNAVIRDDRAFHLYLSDWIERFEKQVEFEEQFYKAWVYKGPSTVKAEALQRLENEGWDKLRLALSTTVRVWFMRGFLAKYFHNYATALEYYTHALEILEWGARTWENVPKTSRGVIFEKTFIRAVRRHTLVAMHNCLSENVQEVNITIGDLTNFASEMVQEIDKNPPSSDDPDLVPGYVAAFWIYPQGEALSIFAWCALQLGKALENAKDAQGYFVDAALFYLKAAKETYADDDENTLTYLKGALDAYWVSPEGMPLKDILPIISCMRGRVDDVQKIWEHSASAKDRGQQLDFVLQFESRCNDALRSGRITENDVARPRELMHAVKWISKCVFI